LNIQRTANYWKWSVCRLHDKTTAFMGVGTAHVSPSYAHVNDDQ